MTQTIEDVKAASMEELSNLPTMGPRLAKKPSHGVVHTFKPLDRTVFRVNDIVLDISDDPEKYPDGICVGVEIPGQIFVLMKPVGGLIDVETLLHEMGTLSS